jgi:hypothetical protein
MFNLTTIKAIISIGLISLSLNVCVFADEATDMAQIKEGYNEKPESEYKLKHIRKSFTFRNHGFEILPAMDSTMAIYKEDPPFFKNYIITGPDRINAHGSEPGSLLSIVVVVDADSNPLPPADDVINELLQPYRKYMSGYSEKPKSIVLSDTKYNGIAFVGAQSGIPSKGLIFATIKQGAMFVFLILDGEKYFTQTEKDFSKLLEGAKLF